MGTGNTHWQSGHGDVRSQSGTVTRIWALGRKRLADTHTLLTAVLLLWCCCLAPTTAVGVELTRHFLSF